MSCLICAVLCPMLKQACWLSLVFCMALATAQAIFLLIGAVFLLFFFSSSYLFNPTTNHVTGVKEEGGNGVVMYVVLHGLHGSGCQWVTFGCL